MKNYEKYTDELKKYNYENFCKDFILPNVLKSDNCGNMSCDECRMLQMIWLFEDYKEPETDWSKVEVDTPILVRDYEGEKWRKRYFAKYENGTIYAWGSGRTSWSGSSMTVWNCVKLAESEEE